MEIWKTIRIHGNKSKYEVSNLGNVRNKESGKVIKGRKGRCGYIQLNLYHDGERYTKNIHSLVAKTFISNPDNLPEVNHINGNKTDNRVENLEWVTRSDNIKHAFATGLKTQYGEDNPSNKYSLEEINKACELLESGNYTCSEVSRITGISFETVGHISRKERWKHITSKYNFENIKRDYGDYSEIKLAVDRAILSGKSRKKIVKVLMRYGLTKIQACNLYRRRKERVESGNSPVNCTVYVNDGIEIF